MDKIFTQRNLLILAIIILLIWIWWKFIRKQELDLANNNLSAGQNISNTNTGNNSSSSTGNNVPATPINPNFGKTAYASFDNVTVYNGVISSATIYKNAKKNEWIGTVEGEIGSWWKVSGNRLVSKGGVYLT